MSVDALLAIALHTPPLPAALCRTEREAFDDDDRQDEAIAVCARCPELSRCREWVRSTAVPPGGVVAGVWREHPLIADDEAEPVGVTGRLLALAVEPVDRDTAARALGIGVHYAGTALSRLARAGRLEVIAGRPKLYRAV